MKRAAIIGLAAAAVVAVGGSAFAVTAMTGQATDTPIALTGGTDKGAADSAAKKQKHAPASQPAVAPGTNQDPGMAPQTTTDGTGVRTLLPMPAGTVTVSRTRQGLLSVRVDLYGLTPGSSHTTAIDGPNLSPVAPVVRLNAVTADATGQVHTTVTSVDTVGRLPADSRFVIRLGAYSGDATPNQVLKEPIAQSDVLPVNLTADTPLAVHALSVGINGTNFGNLSGQATFSYDAQAQTLTVVVVKATGFAPGTTHAAHIHFGSCQSQGGVAYMLTDLRADANGQIINQTRVVTGVTSAPANGLWYLNIHQGNSNEILVNGVPAPSFRPLLCANIGTVPGLGVNAGSPASANDMPSMSPSPSSSVIYGGGHF